MPNSSFLFYGSVKIFNKCGKNTPFLSSFPLRWRQRETICLSELTLNIYIYELQSLFNILYTGNICCMATFVGSNDPFILEAMTVLQLGQLDSRLGHTPVGVGGGGGVSSH